MTELVFVTFQYPLNTVTSKDSKLISLITQLQEKIQLHHEFVTLPTNDSPSNPSTENTKNAINLTLFGTYPLIIACKDMIFQSNIVKTVVQISCLREIIYTVETINPRVHDIISNISVETGTEISVVDNLTGCALKIEGGSQDVENARLQILLKLDSLFGLQNSDCQLRFQMQPLVCGKQRDQLLQLQFTNDVYLYLPIAYTLDSTENSYYDTVYISGNSLENINQTILCLKDKTMELETSIIQKKVVLSPRKMEWLFHHKKLQVRKICRDNAVTIQFPKVNSNNTNTVIFTGFNNNLVNRAIRMVKLLLCEYYVMSIQTATQFESLEQFQKYCSQLQLLIFPIFTKYNVEILVHKNIIEICGSSHDCQQAYLTMTNFDMIKIRDTKVQVELAFEHKDFINGKKNGKINRIIKQSGCRITFQENPSEINMIIDLYSPQPQQLIQGLGMLEEELPAEMSFYVPELYHKRIIGVAGKNIQKIMKRFGVYVKFSNTAEFELLCGYYENRDNVICRTPAKNKENLTDLKATILEVVNNPDLNEVESTVLVPRQLFNIVFGDGILKEQVYERFKHVLSFPDNEQGSDRVLLFGPEHLAQNAIDFIKEHIPIVRSLRAKSNEIDKFLKGQDFGDFRKAMTAKEVQLRVGLLENEICIYYIMKKDTKASTQELVKKEILALFSRNELVYGQTKGPTSEQTSGFKPALNVSPQSNPGSSFDTFSHFNSKLLGATTVMPTDPASNSRQQSFGFFSEQSVPNNQSSNIRQLFDNGANSPPALRKSTVSLMSARNSTISGSNNNQSSSATSMQQSNNPPSLRERNGEFLNRQGLPVPELTDMTFTPTNPKSHSMTDMMLKSSLAANSDPSSFQYPWTSMPFNKSLSTSAIIKEDKQSDFSPTDQEFYQKMEDQVEALDTESLEDIDKIGMILRRLQFEKYLPHFVEHEIDYKTFLGLEDNDLKELGIKALGTRKKIMACIKSIASQGE